MLGGVATPSEGHLYEGGFRFIRPRGGIMRALKRKLEQGVGRPKGRFV
mgnify:CR=1 FL=1